MEKYEEIIKKYPSDKSYLIEMLREIQVIDGYISNEAIKAISEEFNILDVDIQGVVSFYSMLSTKPKGRNVIRICKTACCKIAGADDIVSLLEKELGVAMGDVTPDGKFSFEQTECIGMCDIAPAMLLNDKPYGKLTTKKIAKILEECK